MAKKEVRNATIQPYVLSNIQIKEKIEDAVSYKPSKYKKTEILFEKKNTNVHKLPFSDFKVAIAQEIEEHNMLLKELEKEPEECTLIEETVVEESTTTPVKEEVEIDAEPQIDVLDEIYDFDDESKKPKKIRSKAKIKEVDTLAIVEKIKEEAREKNKGKKVITRRDINKELKPYMLKRMTSSMNDDTLTSIDIYLNAVNKIETTGANNKQDSSLELNLEEILEDLEK